MHPTKFQNFELKYVQTQICLELPTGDFSEVSGCEIVCIVELKQ